MTRDEKNQRLLKKLLWITLGMFAFGFAMVPIYNVMCKQLGINGKPSLDVVQAERAAAKQSEDVSRTITVEFVTTMNEETPWEFYPMKTRVDMHPGGSVRTAYYARNLTDKPMVIQAIPSISPGKAARHVKKLECFCFTRQPLGPHETAELPLTFILGSDVPDDVNTMTLAYTLFDVTDR